MSVFITLGEIQAFYLHINVAELAEMKNICWVSAELIMCLFHNLVNTSTNTLSYSKKKLVTTVFLKISIIINISFYSDEKCFFSGIKINYYYFYF